MSRTAFVRNVAYVLAGALIIGASVRSSSSRWNAGLPRSSGAVEVENSSAGVVYVIFSAQDCASDIEALVRWNALHDGGTEVQGVLYGEAGPSTLHKVVAGAGLRFPVTLGPARRIRELRSRSGYRAGSFVAVVDAENHLRIAFALRESAQQPTDLLIGSLATGEKAQ